MSSDGASPLLRGHLHLLAFLSVVPAGAVLVARAGAPMARVACAIYAISLLITFGTSAGYHVLTSGGRPRAVMQRLDHAMIFVLISGTYVPLCLVALPRRWGVPLLAVVGAGAALGIVTKLVSFHRAGRVSTALYLVLGWAAVAVAPVLFTSLRGPELLLLLLGGAAYTGGVPVLLRHRPDPWPRVFGYHEIWHVCTVVAAVLHFAAVARITG